LTRYLHTGYEDIIKYSGVRDSAGNILSESRDGHTIYQLGTAEAEDGTESAQVKEFKYNDKYREIYNPQTREYLQNFDRVTLYDINNSNPGQSILNQLEVYIQPNKVQNYQPDFNMVQRSEQFLGFSGNLGDKYYYDLRTANMYHQVGDSWQPLDLENIEGVGNVYKNGRDEYLALDKDYNLKLLELDLK